MEKKFPISCPSCSAALQVQSLVCSQCNTQVNGSFLLPALLQLTQDEQQFVLSFVKTSGSLKQMAEQLKLSYPTVRNMLDDIIEKLKSLETIEKNRK
jgi:hypothetical protein